MGGKGFSTYCILLFDISSTSTTGSCRWASSDCLAAQSRPCICNGANDYCFAGSCASCGCIPFSKTNSTNRYGTNTLNINCCSSATNCNFDAFWWGQVVGINGLNGSDCFDTNFYGCKIHPPIYGFESVSQCILQAAGATVGGLCCNGCGYNFMRYPGAGGTGVFFYAGCTATTDPSGCFGSACGGDIGRGGMVCVSYC